MQNNNHQNLQAQDIVEKTLIWFTEIWNKLIKMLTVPQDWINSSHSFVIVYLGETPKKYT